MRFFYKLKNSKVYISLKTPDFDNDKNYERITEKEYTDRIKELEEEIKEAKKLELGSEEVE